MEAEIREQPQVLAQNSQNYFEKASALNSGEIDLVVIAARGSSDHAALYLRYLIEIHLGIPVSLAAPSVITRYGSKLKYKNCLGVGISQSGQGPDVAGVLEYIEQTGNQTIAITNSGDSRLANATDHVIELGVGLERSVAATKTYSSSLLACYQLTRALGADLPDPAAHLPTDAWIANCFDHAEKDLGRLIRSSVLIALARGYSYCTAMETALKLMECALLPCKGYSTADFEHGPKALTGHGAAAIVYGEVPSGLSETGTLFLEAPKSGETVLAPIWDVVYGQCLALLAARARGLDPDAPRNLSKVTQTL